MKKRSIICLLLLLYISVSAQNRAYYISTDGSDANDGLSAATPWQTLSHINSMNLQPGDQVLLNGRQVFNDHLQLDSNDRGTAANPIIIRSYGTGTATIYAVNKPAVFARNAGGIQISNLIFKGDGSDNDGLYFLITQSSSNIEYIHIDSIEVFNFGGRGFLMGADSTDKGFDDVKVQRSSFHDNGTAGLETFGNWPLISNSNFYIGYCKFYNNSGKLTSAVTTGNGIVVSGVNNGLIEYCEAYNNGANNRAPGGGPVGIWVYDTKNVTIQYCESHHNKAGLFKDGGGFDIDGGSQNCTVQYCYSHDNEGPGLALIEYGSPNQFTGNVIRYNVSQNDARKNSYGALAFFAVDSLHQVINSEVYNNTIYVDANNLINGKPSAVNIQSKNFSGLSVRNNIFYVNSGVDLMNSLYDLSNSEIYFRSNNYFSSAGSYDFWWDSIHYTSLDSWKLAATGQETLSGVSVGITQNPLLEGAGSGGTISPADGGRFNALFGYTLNPFSPLIDKAVKIGDIGTHDFFGNALPSTSNYDIGAAEAVGIYPLPLSVFVFSGEKKNNQILLQWKVANEQYLDKYEIQKSFNGIDYKTIGFVPAGQYSFDDNANASGDVYYRLKYIYPNGRFGISNSIKIPTISLKEPFVVYKEGQGLQILFSNNKENKAVINIFSTNGSLMYTAPHALSAGYNCININNAADWKHGVYFVQIATTKTTVTRFVK